MVYIIKKLEWMGNSLQADTPLRLEGKKIQKEGEAEAATLGVVAAVITLAVEVVPDILGDWTVVRRRGVPKGRLTRQIPRIVTIPTGPTRVPDPAELARVGVEVNRLVGMG